MQLQATNVPCHQVRRVNRKCISCNTSTAGGRTNLGSMPGFPFTVACKSDTEVTVAGHQSLVASITFARTTFFFLSFFPPPPCLFLLSCFLALVHSGKTQICFAPDSDWQRTDCICSGLLVLRLTMHWPYSGQLLRASETDVVHWLLLLSLVSLRRTIAHYVLRPRHTVQLLLSRLL